MIRTLGGHTQLGMHVPLIATPPPEQRATNKKKDTCTGPQARCLPPCPGLLFFFRALLLSFPPFLLAAAAQQPGGGDWAWASARSSFRAISASRAHPKAPPPRGTAIPASPRPHAPPPDPQPPLERCRVREALRDRPSSRAPASSSAGSGASPDPDPRPRAPPPPPPPPPAPPREAATDLAYASRRLELPRVAALCRLPHAAVAGFPKPRIRPADAAILLPVLTRTRRVPWSAPPSPYEPDPRPQPARCSSLAATDRCSRAVPGFCALSLPNCCGALGYARVSADASMATQALVDAEGRFLDDSASWDPSMPPPNILRRTKLYISQRAPRRAHRRLCAALLPRHRRLGLVHGHRSGGRPHSLLVRRRPRGVC
ncbi:hypothetical protein BRADI_1g22642v3 [Brachypodium distachyon]|uniref:Uncharacterized protein n=1 Tax=Brachypodium distachyon TaxID=15368 RepID=A0A0Q3KW40_BRADI|nr:hypothetical protein BRADI_1g22642v3 [Brachypodium distachyon]